MSNLGFKRSMPTDAKNKSFLLHPTKHATADFDIFLYSFNRFGTHIQCRKLNSAIKTCFRSCSCNFAGDFTLISVINLFNINEENASSSAQFVQICSSDGRSSTAESEKCICQGHSHFAGRQPWPPI